MRKTWLIAGMLTATALTSTVTASPAAASVNGPTPITTWTSSVAPHRPTWITIFWATNKKICDAEVTVAADEVDVSYPANTVDFTSFSQSAKLTPKRIDYTAVRVTAHHPGGSFLPLEVTMKYHTCGGYAADVSDTFHLTLPVLDNAVS